MLFETLQYLHFQFNWNLVFGRATFRIYMLYILMSREFGYLHVFSPDIFFLQNTIKWQLKWSNKQKVNAKLPFYGTMNNQITVKLDVLKYTVFAFNLMFKNEHQLNFPLTEKVFDKRKFSIIGFFFEKKNENTRNLPDWTKSIHCTHLTSLESFKNQKKPCTLFYVDLYHLESKKSQGNGRIRTKRHVFELAYLTYFTASFLIWIRMA